MLVKKINPEWFPSEAPSLLVGETTEITDPKTLILAGDVVAIGKMGEEISAHDLYGVIVKNEMDEFIEYQKIKKAKAMKERLEKEAMELEAKLMEADSASKIGKKDDKSKEHKNAVNINKMSWNELKALGSKLEVFTPSINKADLIKAIKNAKK